MPRVGFEPTISAGERPKTYALDRAATGTGNIILICYNNNNNNNAMSNNYRMTQDLITLFETPMSTRSNFFKICGQIRAHTDRGQRRKV